MINLMASLRSVNRYHMLLANVILLFLSCAPNPGLNPYPAIGAILRNGAVKGLISGLGLLDIWIGISEVIQYRDYRG